MFGRKVNRIVKSGFLWLIKRRILFTLVDTKEVKWGKSIRYRFRDVKSGRIENSMILTLLLLYLNKKERSSSTTSSFDPNRTSGTFLLWLSPPLTSFTLFLLSTQKISLSFSRIYYRDQCRVLYFGQWRQWYWVRCSLRENSGPVDSPSRPCNLVEVKEGNFT